MKLDKSSFLDKFSRFKPRDLLLRRVFLVLADFVSMLLGFWLVSFAMPVYPDGISALDLPTIATLSLLNIIIYLIGGLYTSLWEYSGWRELIQIAFTTLAATAVDLLFGLIFKNRLRFVQYIFVWIILLLFGGGIRLSYRLMRSLKNWISVRSRRANRRVMLIGADSNGAMLASKMQDGSLQFGMPVVFLDDDARKIGRRIHGIKVVGGLDRIDRAIALYSVDEIVIARPDLSPETLKDIYDASVMAGCDLKILQNLEELLVSGDEERVDSDPIVLRDFDVDDLLGRKSLHLNTERINADIAGKTVLITGGGGSIGSEIARQIARYNPAVIVLFDIYENLVFENKNYLIQKYADTIDVQVEIGSIQDETRLRQLFREYRPDFIFHAAAHKHVPLMEQNPGEALKNNVFGTNNLTRLCDEFKVGRFVMISTDKAVNPTSTMGASKTLAEKVVQSCAAEAVHTKFACVRFGNVLNSSGSVIPIFRKQLAAGGPLTVTDENVVRYFMTIPEAAALVLEAASMATGGEIYILNMGQPVRIMELAENLIKLSGLEPHKDIKIVITGLRPGEKLYEELNYETENLLPTDNPDIMVAQPHPVSAEMMNSVLRELRSCLDKSNGEIKETIRIFVPTYQIDTQTQDQSK
ncbi:MAG: polysaccharide biosynthesis protein [Fastidiosipilaceae bacterium]|jgi:FlaA1/EpsC-like NDP-sugar epimerase